MKWVNLEGKYGINITSLYTDFSVAQIQSINIFKLFTNVHQFDTNVAPTLILMLHYVIQRPGDQCLPSRYPHKFLMAVDVTKYYKR